MTTTSIVNRLLLALLATLAVLGFTAQSASALTPQTVTWTPNTSILMTGAPITPSSLATSSGPGAIGYWKDTWNTTAGCSVDATTGVITAWAVGTCVIVADAASGNGYSYASTSVSFVLTKVQTVTWNPANTQFQVLWSPFGGTPAASSEGTGSISYAVQSAGTTGCTINSATRTISFSAIGACVIRATAAASGNWLSGYTDVTFRIVDTQYVLWLGTTITQSSGTYTPNQAYASGGGVIDYSVLSAGTTGCTVDPATGVITFTAIGQCQVAATARANGFYLATGPSQANFNFYSNQTVTWTPTNNTNSFSGGTITPNAVASANGGGAITYSLTFANALCSLNTSTGAVSASARARCYVRANAAAAGFYNSGVSNSVVFTFTGPQTVTWTPSNTTNQVTRSVTANALPVSNGGLITYSVAQAGTAGCSVNAATGVISAATIGTCTIRSTAAAFLTYESGFADLLFTFVEGQIISWPASNTSNPDSVATLTPNALASSNLGSAISYSVQSAGTTGCSVNSATAVITVASAGLCVIRATAAASGSVGSDYRDFSFTFTASSSSTSSISMSAWNPRVVLLGSQPLVSIFGLGFTSDVTISLAGTTLAPKSVSANELTFTLPKLSVGLHSFEVAFKGQAVIFFVDAVRVVSPDPIVMTAVATKTADANSNLLQVQNSLTRLLKSVGVPVKLVCTAHMESASSVKDRKMALNSTKLMCEKTAARVGAKTSISKVLLTSKSSSMSRKLSLAVEFLG